MALAAGLAGCKGSDTSPPRPEDVPFSRSAAPLWTVEAFQVVDGWSGSDDRLTEAAPDWGEALAGMVEARLTEQNLRAELVARGLGDRSLHALANRGVRYAVGGRLEALSLTRVGQDVVGEVVVLYTLTKKVGDREVGLIQERRLTAQDLVSDPPSADDARELLQHVAVKLVERVREDVPGDVVASRGSR